MASPPAAVTIYPLPRCERRLAEVPRTSLPLVSLDLEQGRPRLGATNRPGHLLRRGLRLRHGAWLPRQRPPDRRGRLHRQRNHLRRRRRGHVLPVPEQRRVPVQDVGRLSAPVPHRVWKDDRPGEPRARRSPPPPICWLGARQERVAPSLCWDSRSVRLLVRPLCPAGSRT